MKYEPKIPPHIKLTVEQVEAIEKMNQRGWLPQLNTLTKLPCEDAVSILAVGSVNRRAVIYFVIEPDGYAHT